MTHLLTSDLSTERISPAVTLFVTTWDGLAVNLSKAITVPPILLDALGDPIEEKVC